MVAPHVTVIVPSYNNEAYVEQNLQSIVGQSYSNMDVVYIDDASTDKTLRSAKAFLKGGRGEVISNNKRLFGMENLFNVISTLPEDEVVVIVDGDDWLARSDAILLIAEYYEKKDALLTFGRYVKYPTFESGPVLEEYYDLDIRNTPWFLSHAKTFVASLFQKINKDDLMINGAFINSAIDLAMMWPMYEMAGKRVHQMDEIIYIYNIENPNHIASSRIGEQAKVAEYLKKLAPYRAI